MLYDPSTHLHAPSLKQTIFGGPNRSVGAQIRLRRQDAKKGNSDRDLSMLSIGLATEPDPSSWKVWGILQTMT